MQYTLHSAALLFCWKTCILYLVDNIMFYCIKCAQGSSTPAPAGPSIHFLLKEV